MFGFCFFRRLLSYSMCLLSNKTGIFWYRTVEHSSKIVGKQCWRIWDDNYQKVLERIHFELETMVRLLLYFLFNNRNCLSQFHHIVYTTLSNSTIQRNLSCVIRHKKINWITFRIVFRFGFVKAQLNAISNRFIVVFFWLDVTEFSIECDNIIIRPSTDRNCRGFFPPSCYRSTRYHVGNCP